jgi:hypothetical protein
MNWSNTTCAPLAKSPNCASHRVQRVGLRQGVAVLEAEHRLFRQHRVDDLEAGLVLGDVIQVRVALLVLLVDEHRVALGEGAALHVLAGEAHPVAFEQERAEGQGLGHGPVEPLAGVQHLLAVVEEALDRAVEMEALRHLGQRIADPLQGLGRDAGLAAAGIVGILRTALRPDQRPSSQSALLGL